MNTKNNIKVLWEYLRAAFEIEEIEAAFNETIEGFEFNVEKMKPSAIEELSDEEARGLFFDIGYMAVNGLFGGDGGTWNEVLCYSLNFDEETIDFLDF